jgi:hypothetical protein
MLDHLKQPELCKRHLLAALEKDPHQERARTLLAKLEETALSPVQPASFTEIAQPGFTNAAPTVEASVPAASPLPAPPARPSRGRVVILPPPPQISIQYEGGPDPSLHEGE